MPSISNPIVMIVAQVLSLFGMATNVLSMQCRKTKHVFILFLVGSVFFSASYLLLGSYASVVLNFYSIARSCYMLADKRARHPAQLIVMCIGLCVCGGVGFYLDGWIAIFPFLGQLGTTIGMWLRNGGKLRVLQLTMCSPSWLINNFLVHSIGGVLCELFVITSTVISIRRYGWKNLLQSD